MRDVWWQVDSNRYTCECGAVIESSTYLWTNGHGFKKRLFCHGCDHYFDIRWTGRDGWSMIRRPMKN